MCLAPRLAEDEQLAILIGEERDVVRGVESMVREAAQRVPDLATSCDVGP